MFGYDVDKSWRLAFRMLSRVCANCDMCQVMCFVLYVRAEVSFSCIIKFYRATWSLRDSLTTASLKTVSIAVIICQLLLFN